MRIAENEGIPFVSGKGKKKSELQKLMKELDAAATNLWNIKSALKSWEKSGTVIPRQTWKPLL